MNKTFRQGQILKLIRTARYHTQEDLAHELRETFGNPATQVTLSRDIRELGLVKTPDGYRQVTARPAVRIWPRLQPSFWKTCARRRI